MCARLGLHSSTQRTRLITLLFRCVVLLQVRIIEAAKEKLQKDMRSSSSKNLAAMVSVQA